MTTTLPLNFYLSINDYVLQDDCPHKVAPCNRGEIQQKAIDFRFLNRQAVAYYSIYGDGIEPKEVTGWQLTAYVWFHPDTSYQEAIENAEMLNTEQCLAFIVADHIGWLEFIAEAESEVFINFDNRSLDIWASKTPESYCFATVTSDDSIVTIADKLRSCSPKDMIRYLVSDRRAVLPSKK